MVELSPTLIAATLAGGYLLGSIPFGVVIMRASRPIAVVARRAG